ncbi:serine hydrolase [Nevskia sp.]|uniref:serine hydrolase n=1 Tax=Nevskia sp. TaxID=1929292 RepID=UPI0025D1C317|nr:serine hydrolase [Nevskia sp.]
MNSASIINIFTRHTRIWHFWLRDLRSGEVLELGTRRLYPIGSCFKLAVLMACFDALKQSAELDRPVVIPPDRFRTGGGVINYLDSAVTLSKRQMLHLMLAASDGTTTDWLIAELGLPAVNRVLRGHAPESHLACDLGDMVTAFRQIPESLDCKTREFSDAELLNFVDATNVLGATHAQDLAGLALAAWRYPASKMFEPDYQRCLAVDRYIPRTKMFFDPAIRIFSKTGSIGRNFFMNDCGVLIDRNTGMDIAHFGFCSSGWRMPGGMVETAGGLIGIEIARALGLNPVLNSDYTEEGAALLLGRSASDNGDVS